MSAENTGEDTECLWFAASLDLKNLLRLTCAEMPWSRLQGVSVSSSVFKDRIAHRTRANHEGQQCVSPAAHVGIGHLLIAAVFGMFRLWRLRGLPTANKLWR